MPVPLKRWVLSHLQALSTMPEPSGNPNFLNWRYWRWGRWVLSYWWTRFKVGLAAEGVERYFKRCPNSLMIGRT